MLSDSTAMDERARPVFEGQVHPKSEPQDVEMATVAAMAGDRGEVQVKTEPEPREKGDKQGDQSHSDNDSSATCSADEDGEAEPDRQR